MVLAFNPCITKILDIVKPLNEPRSINFAVPFEFEHLPNNSYTKFALNVVALYCGVTVPTAIINIISLASYCSTKLALIE